MLRVTKVAILTFSFVLSMAEATQQTISGGQTHSDLSRLTPGGPSQVHSIQSKAGGGERSYRIYLPQNYSVRQPAPLILAFHGKGQNTSTFESETQLSSSGFNNDIVVVYPQGIKV